MFTLFKISYYKTETIRFMIDYEFLVFRPMLYNVSELSYKIYLNLFIA
jgi:5-methylthioribose kinase